MTLSDIEVFVGVVIEVKDPLNLGRVKVTSPGFFSLDTMTKDDIFWISPLGFNYQNYSQLNVGNKVWVLHNLNNYLEYWYFPYFELNPNTQALMHEGNDLDVLVSRTTGSGASVQMVYDTPDGIRMSHTEGDTEHKVQLDPAGNVNIVGNTGINIVTKGVTGRVTIGQESKGHERAINGETLVESMKKIIGYLNDIAAAMLSNPYTASIGNMLMTKVADWNTQYSESNLLSKSVNICK